MDERPALCPNCNLLLSKDEVKTAIFQGERLAVIENVPALVCPSCREQFYDDDVSEALRRLGEEGFPDSQADRRMEVPVFSLEGRVRKRKPLPEDTYVD